MNKNRSLRVIRWIILLSILVLTTVLGRLHQMIKFYPSIDAFCPFGGLESAWVMIRYQGILHKVAWSSFILLFVTIGTAIIFRRSFCGEICPLGFLQELFGLAGRKVLQRRFNLPRKLDNILRYLKYPVLVIFLGLAWRTMELSIRPYDPWVAYHHLGSDELFSKNLIGFIVLVLSLGLGFISDRPFCRYLCPMGGFLGIISKIGVTRIKRNVSSCTDCGLCDKNCPVNIEVSKQEIITSAECLTCSECINTCPVKDTLSYVTPGKKSRKIPTSIVLFGTLLIFVITITINTITKQFIWKADTGLEHKVERLYWGPQRLKSDNTLYEVVQVYQIHPNYFANEFALTEEDQFYLTLKELDIDPNRVEEIVNDLYKEAGRDPKKLLGGGCGNH